MPDFLSPTILNQLKLYRYKVYLTIFNLRYRDQSHFLAKNNFSPKKMVFVQIYISGPGPWSSQSVSYFSGQWSRSATGGIHARPNFPGFSCLPGHFCYLYKNKNTNTLKTKHSKDEKHTRKDNGPNVRPNFPDPSCLLGYFCYLYKSVHKQKCFIDIFSFDFYFLLLPSLVALGTIFHLRGCLRLIFYVSEVIFFIIKI